MKDKFKKTAAGVIATVAIAGGVILVADSDQPVRPAAALKDVKWKSNEAEELPQLTRYWPENFEKMKSGKYEYEYNDDGSVNLYAQDELENYFPVLQFDCKPVAEETKFGGEIK